MRTLVKEEKFNVFGLMGNIPEISEIKDESGNVLYLVKNGTDGSECSLTDLKGREYAHISTGCTEDIVAVLIDFGGNPVGHITRNGLNFLGWTLTENFYSLYYVIEDDNNYNTIIKVRRNYGEGLMSYTEITVYDDDTEILALAVMLAVESYHKTSETLKTKERT